MSRILIAGGTGFIGRALSLFLNNKGHNVVALGVKPRSFPSFSNTNIQTVFVDLARVPLTNILSDPDFDFVINLSGYIDHSHLLEHGQKVFHAHTESLFNLIGSIDRGCLKSFIQVGSSDEYGNTSAPQIESQREQCLGPYSLAKLANSHLIQTLYQIDRFPGMVVRPFLIYGPGQSDNRLIPFVIQQCIANNRFDISPGEQLRDFLFIDDFCEGIFKLMVRQDLSGRVFNIASGIGVPVRDVINKIVDLVGSGKPNFGGKQYRTGESMSLYADTSALECSINWKPKIKLEDGLRMTINAMLNGT